MVYDGIKYGELSEDYKKIYGSFLINLEKLNKIECFFDRIEAVVKYKRDNGLVIHAFSNLGLYMTYNGKYALFLKNKRVVK